MALSNIRLLNDNIVADRSYKGKQSVKVIATPGFKGIYKWKTTNEAARDQARDFAKLHNLKLE